MHEEFGASPRDLAFYAHKPNVYEAHLREEIDQIYRDHVLRVIQDPRNCNVSRYITTMEPSATTRMISEVKLASRRVVELLQEKRYGPATRYPS